MQSRTLPSPKSILKFAFFAVVIYALLMWPSTRRERAYAAYFRGFGNVVFSQFWLWPKAYVKFLDLHSPTLFQDFDRATPGELPPNTPILGPDGKKDTLMVMMNHSAPGSIGQLRTWSGWIGYEPTVVLIALALSTPIILRRRLWLLFWGLLLVHLFMAIRLSFVLLDGGYAANKRYSLFDVGPFARSLIWRFKEIFADNPAVSLVVPFFLYLIALFALQLWYSRRESK